MCVCVYGGGVYSAEDVEEKAVYRDVKDMFASFDSVSILREGSK